MLSSASAAFSVRSGVAVKPTLNSGFRNETYRSDVRPEVVKPMMNYGPRSDGSRFGNASSFRRKDKPYCTHSMGLFRDVPNTFPLLGNTFPSTLKLLNLSSHLLLLFTSKHTCQNTLLPSTRSQGPCSDPHPTQSYLELTWVKRGPRSKFSREDSSKRLFSAGDFFLSKLRSGEDLVREVGGEGEGEG
ncbi:unnamed protein product [Fraxinus pennsylvanica]|uniref:Uncharacterized protein n=1 Tax=Fraxinus pennsylvanica TaxID=56036 RepID=A0AAD1YWB1_9LAMI|nr:unnamed protein product [Fraxinus pennsylvanica]